MENVVSNNVNIDIESIATELVIGPQEKLMREINELNNSYITRTYMYGNRSALEPLPPLGITRTYRWKPGYKNVILETINTRFDQYNKNTSNLTTLLLNRPERMRWNKKNFIGKILDIDDTLKDLRKRKITTDSTVDTAVEKFDEVISIFQDRVKYAEEFLEAFDDIDIHSYIRYADMEDEDNVYNEMMKWKTASINVELKLNNPNVTIYGPDKDNNTRLLAKVPTEPIYLHFDMPLNQLVNALFSKEIEDITHSDLVPSNKYESVTTRQRNDGLYRYAMGVKVVGRWLGKEVNHHSRNSRIYEHPFMSSVSDLNIDMRGTTYWSQWSEEDNVEGDYQCNICFGNLQDDIYNAFAKLNIIGLIQTLQSWLTYKCGVTGPLNSISYSILYLDQDYHEDLPLAIGLSIDSMYSRVLEMFGMDTAVAANPLSTYRNSDDYTRNGLQWSNRSDWHPHFDKGENVTDIVYGWDFTADNWLPLKTQVLEVCDEHHYTKVFLGLNSDSLPFDEPNYDGVNDTYKEIQDNYICKVQEGILDEVIATVEWFYDNNCQSISSIEFAYMTDFLYRIGYFEQEVPVLLEETNRFQDMIRVVNQSLPSTTKDLHLESEDQTDIIEEVVSEEQQEEEEEELSYEEQMNSYNWERRIGNVVQD